MAEPPIDDEAALAAAARHALHDEELVAGLAGGVLDPDETLRARSLVDRCLTCRSMAADMVALTAAHRSTAGMSLAAPRDFRLTVEDARRLGRPAGLRVRLRHALAPVGRPLGGALVAAGLVGVMVGSVGMATLGGSGSLPMLSAEDQGAAQTLRVGEAPPKELEPAVTDAVPRGAEAEPPAGGGNAAAPNPAAAVIAASIVLLLIGIGLLAATLRRPRAP